MSVPDLTNQTYIGLILLNRPPSYFDDPTVFSGTAGRAMLFYKLFVNTQNSTYLELAGQ